MRAGAHVSSDPSGVTGNIQSSEEVNRSFDGTFDFFLLGDIGGKGKGLYAGGELVEFVCYRIDTFLNYIDDSYSADSVGDETMSNGSANS